MRRVILIIGNALTLVSVSALLLVLFGPPDLVPAWLLGSGSSPPVAASPPEASSRPEAIGPDSTAPAAAFGRAVEATAATAPAADAAATPVPISVSRPVLPPLVGEAWFRDQPVAITPVAASVPIIEAAPVSAPVSPDPQSLPITGLRISNAAIETKVVEAPLIDEPDGSVSWQVPKFVAGHAESTAGAGEPGNAVLFGHVTSQTLGNVFENLRNTHMGDVVEVLSGDKVFRYRVVDIRDVSRTDSSVVDPTDIPTLTLITCTGLWNPMLHDYMERLVVQAQMVDLASGQHQ